MNGPLPYIGGKSQLSKKIVQMIPEHKTYCEVFAGGCWVFFRKEESKVEVINDLDSQLVCFFRVLQNHLEEFCKQFKYLVTSREWFEDWKRQMEADGLTDIQRAARYYYLQRLCFAGRVRGRVFGASKAKQHRINLLRLEEDLSAVHIRLSRTTIESLPWDDFVGRYDRKETFFYLDPPYWGKTFYAHNLKREDYEHMAELLLGIEGKFLLSLNDIPEVRATFKAFDIEPVTLKYSASGGPQTVGKEVLIRNY